MIDISGDKSTEMCKDFCILSPARGSCFEIERFLINMTIIRLFATYLQREGSIKLDKADL